MERGTTRLIVNHADQEHDRGHRATRAIGYLDTREITDGRSVARIVPTLTARCSSRSATTTSTSGSSTRRSGGVRCRNHPADARPATHLALRDPADIRWLLRLTGPRVQWATRTSTGSSGSTRRSERAARPWSPRRPASSPPTLQVLEDCWRSVSGGKGTVFQLDREAAQDSPGPRWCAFPFAAQVTAEFLEASDMTWSLWAPASSTVPVEQTISQTRSLTATFSRGSAPEASSAASQLL